MAPIPLAIRECEVLCMFLMPVCVYVCQESLSFAVVVLVASIPLAVEIVTNTTLAMGSRTLSKKGAIVTKLTSIEEMAGMDMLCSDKTGTLTQNKMVIQDDCPIFTPGETIGPIHWPSGLSNPIA